MADLLTKRKGCICTRKRPVTFLIFPANPFNSSWEKKHTRIVCRPARQMAETVIRSISCSLQLGLKSNESKKYGDKTVKWTFGYYNFFVTYVSMIFIRENAAFIHVLIYQDWHNKLLNMIN